MEKRRRHFAVLGSVISVYHKLVRSTLARENEASTA